MAVGTRIIYDADGQIIEVYGDMEGGVSERPQWGQLDYIDIDFGQINLMTHRVVGVNTESRTPILEEIDNETEEEKRIRELEDTLLLATDNEIGGIL
ncbi:hypothetical protein P9B03_03860 [Metasolibacillus meyeri]|uniref:DUF2283 domain-containing protein n=1 Tax=Metasolibacillus meyeri TaxID=1071052 RepID=A0AAW9NQM8_9BACL|nr:hypothetical protein [Metasolibacillus meyeri]MEC1177609.1 hypothetical protein [Metasolibacillus meyeri]